MWRIRSGKVGSGIESGSSWAEEQGGSEVYVSAPDRCPAANNQVWRSLNILPGRVSIEEDHNHQLDGQNSSEAKKKQHGLMPSRLKANHWNRRNAAGDLKISYRTLLYEIRKMGPPSKRCLKQSAKPTQDADPSSPSTD